MTGTIVRILPDGEELVVEGRARTRSADTPRERTLETRRLAVEHDAPAPQPSRS